MAHDIVSLKIQRATGEKVTRFNRSIRHNEGGSDFLGYVYTELVMTDVIEQGVDFEIGMPDIEVKLTVEGEFRIDFKQDKKLINGKEQWVARYFTANAASRTLLTELIRELPAVQDAEQMARAARADGSATAERLARKAERLAKAAA